MKTIKIITSLQFVFSITFLNAQIDYEMFKGQEVKTSIEIALKNVFFKEYGNENLDKHEDFYLKDKTINSSSPENVAKLLYSADDLKFYKKLFIDEPYKISDKELGVRKTSDTLKTGLRLVHRLTFDHKNETLSFLKIKELRDSVPVSTKLIALKKAEGNSWKILNEGSFPDVEYVIKNIKARAFWEFFNRIDNEDYPAINKLKPLAQDGNKILDATKLSNVIKANRDVLSKYLD